MTDRRDQPRQAASPVRPRLGRALMIAAVGAAVVLVALSWPGIARLWPKPVVVVEQTGGTVLAGKALRSERFRLTDSELSALPSEDRARLAADGGQVRRVLYRRLDLDTGGADSVWVADFAVTGTSRPLDLFLIERSDARPVAGRIAGLILNDRAIAESAITMPRLREVHRAARARRDEIDRLQNSADAERRAALEARDTGDRLVIEDVTGRSAAIPLSGIVRFHAPNNIGFLDRLRVFAARWVHAVSAGRQDRRD